MRVAVIGATGHIGSYLVPRLVADGHEVIGLSRGRSAPYRENAAWAQVSTVTVDRHAEDDAGTFGPRIAALQPDAVVDLVCFAPESAAQLVAALAGRDVLLLHCGTIWVHGPAAEVPVTEDAPRRPFGDYGVGKAAVEEFLHRQVRESGLRCIILHPGHISGPGWPVVNPAGNFDLGVWRALAAGEPLTLPNFGLETVHHVHADDVAQAFQRALAAPAAAVGESFHIVSERAVTLRGFAAHTAALFGREANLRFAPFAEFSARVPAEHATATLDHIAHSPSMSIAKAQRLLGYAPRYTSMQAVAEAVRWLRENGRLGPDMPAMVDPEVAMPPAGTDGSTDPVREES